ncbi:MAG: hypothetical protein HC771_17645 [Synechococcales cyanobacterium CRU_2_2]|nr:hypothetical protein [Synechococcales cyanobacterium CRU_2_2]
MAPTELSPTPAPQREGDRLRHILLGSPAAIRQTIHQLHHLRYIDAVHWSPIVAIPQDSIDGSPRRRLILTPQAGEMMSLLVRHL